MREIKVRGWRQLGIKGEMEYYFDVIQIPTNYHNTVILMQFTGLKDKNDKEIYEGDIILSKELVKREIIYFDTLLTWYATIPGDNDNLSAFPLAHWIIHGVDTIEIIGNIYENPELLKESGVLKDKEGGER